MILRADGVTLGYGGRPVVHDVTLDITEGASASSGSPARARPRWPAPSSGCSGP
ncbi:hypothetical protein [Nonomuraea recticatena]|uniref:hypothetical protein n=1 Tax=Nonomuraea recticatena TaxID=46178 RepID=UPI00360E5025